MPCVCPRSSTSVAVAFAEASELRRQRLKQERAAVKSEREALEPSMLADNNAEAGSDKAAPSASLWVRRAGMKPSSGTPGCIAIGLADPRFSQEYCQGMEAIFALMQIATTDVSSADLLSGFDTLLATSNAGIEAEAHPRALVYPRALVRPRRMRA